LLALRYLRSLNENTRLWLFSNPENSAHPLRIKFQKTKNNFRPTISVYRFEGDTMTTADVLIETLMDWGVEYVFGLPGDGINGIMEALRIRQDKIRFIQVRHEESAALMACGYTKTTGKLGVCLLGNPEFGRTKRTGDR
jgi:thiamine pyrophosphate-dependent enzyme